MPKRASTPNRSIGINVGSQLDLPTGKLLITSLAKALELAIRNGQREIGVELASRLGKLGAVEQVTLTSCMVTQS